MEFIDILPVVYLTIGLVSTYFIGRLVLSHMTQIKKVKRGIEVQKEKKNLENGIDELLENAPQMYAKVMAELQYLKENGADEKQMASLQRKADLLKMAVDNQEIINLAGKPIIKYLGGFLKGIGK
jgi:phosphoserine aminotransferase|tara:strand:+ start:1121 stop:1495 length:375 start_codon:yes stop_codon:yes gene_type:complete